MRRDRQVHDHALCELHRFAHKAAGNVKLRLLRAEHLRAHHEQNRVDAVGHHHRAGLPLRPPGVAVEPTVLAGRGVHPDLARAVQHLPVHADVDAPGVGIAGEGDVAGADVATAVARPELGHRQFREINVLAGENDLVHRCLLRRNHHRWNLRAHDAAGLGDELGERKIRVEPDRKRIAPGTRAEHVDQYFALRILGEVREQQCRRVLALRSDAGDRGELLIEVHLRVDALEFTRRLHLFKPLAHIARRATAVGGGGDRLAALGDVAGDFVHVLNSCRIRLVIKPGKFVYALRMPTTRAGAPSMPFNFSGSAINVNSLPIRSRCTSIWIIGMPALSQRL